MLNVSTDNIFTGFPQKLWKTLKSPIVIYACLIMLSIVILSSCSYLKGGKKQDKEARPSSTEASKQAEQKASEAPQVVAEKKVAAPPKEPNKEKLVPGSGVIGMTEAEVKKKYGDPDIVSKTPDNRILWTYQPTWKLLPDNKGTIYVEFESGKVTKIIRTR